MGHRLPWHLPLRLISLHQSAPLLPFVHVRICKLLLALTSASLLADTHHPLPAHLHFTHKKPLPLFCEIPVSTMNFCWQNHSHNYLQIGGKIK
jgi:hypothetical protein